MSHGYVDPKKHQQMSTQTQRADLFIPSEITIKIYMCCTGLI